MKALAAALVAVAVVLGYLYLAAPESTQVKVGMLAPELELPSVGPGTVKLSHLRGKPVLLVFFMSDCHLCQTEIPQIERINREYRLKGLVVVGVAVDRDYAARERFLREKEVTFGVLRDPNGDAIRAAFGSYKMPEAYLLDAGGRVAAVWLGSTPWESRAVRQKIEDILPKAVGGL